MKRIHSMSVATMLAVSLLRADTLPGQVEFSAFTPPEGGGELVEVKLQGALLQLAAKLAGKDEPEIAKVLESLKLVRVNVVAVTDHNRTAVQGQLEGLRGKLGGEGWEQLVNVQEKRERVGVYVKSRGSEAIEGVVVMVEGGGKEVVFVNVVGDVKPEQLQKLGEKLDLAPLRKLRGVAPAKEPAAKEAK